MPTDTVGGMTDGIEAAAKDGTGVVTTVVEALARGLTACEVDGVRFAAILLADATEDE